MNIVKIKPLSVNQAWQGKRFKTPEYKSYIKELSYMLPRIIIPEGDLRLRMTFGFSSAASDWDNPIKPAQDIFQSHYGFNDNRITTGIVKKVKVNKGEEFIEFDITQDIAPAFTTNGSNYFKDGKELSPEQVIELMEKAA